MDEELKKYLDAMSADIITALDRMEGRIISVLKPREPNVGAAAPTVTTPKIEDKKDDSDASRIEAGH
jgi:hypothetical protein